MFKIKIIIIIQMCLCICYWFCIENGYKNCCIITYRIPGLNAGNVLWPETVSCVCVVCVQNLIYSIASKQRCLCTKIAANECYFAYNWIKMKKKEKKKLFCSKQWIWLLFIALPKKENKRKKKMFYKRYEGQQFYIVIQIWRIETVGIYQVLHERAKVKKEYQQVIIREKKTVPSKPFC